VNNAGIAGPTGRVEEINPEDWDRCLDVCITGHFNCTSLAVPHLRKSRNASIVNLSCAAGRFGFPLRTPYAAAKWAVVGFTKSLSRELGENGIRVNAILPPPQPDCEALKFGHQRSRDALATEIGMDQQLADLGAMGLVGRRVVVQLN
jgi:NAD(P)-dependent dehydrogenase (short-subunit alcohol dehydrogenase family)